MLKKIQVVIMVALKRLKTKRRKRDLEDRSISESDTLSTEPKSSKPVKDQEQDTKNESNPTVGQWGTAALGDSKRQEKFLRLLGGFKSASKDGKSGITLTKFSKDSNQSNPGVNCAMNKVEEETYKSNMTSQYERAMSMNQNRGIGLGFDTSSIGKKFHIDKFHSKSVKFFD